MASRLRHRLSWSRTTGPALTLADLAAVLLAGLLTCVVVGAAPDATWLAAVALASAVACLVAGAADLHRPRLGLSALEDLPGLLVTALAGTATLAVATRVADADGPGGAAATAAFAAVSFVLLSLARACVYAVTHLLRRTGRLRRRVVVVGSGPVARRLAHALLSHPEYGLVPVGFVDDGRSAARGLPLPLLGGVEALPRAMAESAVDDVVVALSEPVGEAERAAILGCVSSRAQVFAVPRFFPPDIGWTRHRRELVGDVSVVWIHRRRTSGPTRLAKRLADALVAGVTLVLVAPVALAVALLVRLESGRGVIVYQPRVDEDGRASTVRKFRTRRAGTPHGTENVWEIDNAGRIGPVGRWLRRTHVDQLPELLRVLVGRARLTRPPGTRGPAAPVAPSQTPAGSGETKVDAGQLTS